MKGLIVGLAMLDLAMLGLIAPEHIAAAAGHATPAPTIAEAMAQGRESRSAPIDQYLMDRAVEIALARSAAPPAIAREAEIWVLGRHGYEMAVKGTNGFVCIVERGWTASLDDPEFGDPALRAPMCLNAGGARFRIPRVALKTRWALAEVPVKQVGDSLRAAAARGLLPAPATDAMGYMLSRQAYFGKKVGNFAPHLMFFFSTADNPSWGAGLPGSPVGVHQDPDEQLTTIYVRVDRWSDGTAAPRAS